MKTIRSPENPGFKELLRLARSTHRQRQAGVALVEGEHLIAAYRARFGNPRRLILSEEATAQSAVPSLAEGLDPGAVWIMAPSLFRMLSQTTTPTGLLALVTIPPASGVTRQPGGSCLLLEDIQDPGNLGALLRIGAAAGLQSAWLSAHCAYAWSSKVLRAGQGAHFAIEINETADLQAVARQFSGKRIAAVVRGGVSLFDARLSGPVAFVFGNEGAGLSDALAAMVDERLSIPMPGEMESLNVASAAAVLIFEKLRQDHCGGNEAANVDSV